MQVAWRIDFADFLSLQAICPECTEDKIQAIIHNMIDLYLFENEIGKWNTVGLSISNSQGKRNVVWESWEISELEIAGSCCTARNFLNQVMQVIYDA